MTVNISIPFLLYHLKRQGYVVSKGGAAPVPLLKNEMEHIS